MRVWVRSCLLARKCECALSAVVTSACDLSFRRRSSILLGSVFSPGHPVLEKKPRYAQGIKPLANRGAFMFIGKNIIPPSRAHQHARSVRFFRIRRKNRQTRFGNIGYSKNTILGFTFLLPHLPRDFPRHFGGPQEMRFALGGCAKRRQKRKHREDGRVKAHNFHDRTFPKEGALGKQKDHQGTFFTFRIAQ